jgi:hypothetical protein
MRIDENHEEPNAVHLLELTDLSPRRRWVTVLLATLLVVGVVAAFGLAVRSAHSGKAQPRIAAVSASSSVTDVTESTLPQAPEVLADVPPSTSVLPSAGVNVDGMILQPSPPDASPTLTRTGAIANAAKIDDNPNVSVTDALLVSFTDPGTILPAGAAQTETQSPISQRLAWVVTVTNPQPENVSQSPFGGKFMATHNELVFDAATGAFLRGFFTP